MMLRRKHIRSPITDEPQRKLYGLFGFPNIGVFCGNCIYKAEDTSSIARRWDPGQWGVGLSGY
jgi:hypothetical protein